MAGFGGNRPKMIMCYICGREYGTKSLPIHIPQCQKKFVEEQLLKPPGERKKLPPPPSDDAIKLAAKDPEAFNKEAYNTWENSALDRCEHCGRTFRPEALAHHRKACTSSKPLRAAGTGLSPASLSNNVIPVSSPGERPGTSGGRVKPTGASSSPMAASLPPAPAARSGGAGPSGSGAGPSKPPAPLAKSAPAGAVGGAGFCIECGAAYPKPEAKFCGDCGTKRP